MVEKRKSGKIDKLETTDGEAQSATAAPDVGGLTASLDALMSIAEEGEKRAVGDVVQLSSRPQKTRTGKTGPTNKKAPAKRVASKRSKQRSSRDKVSKDDETGTQGVVELLSALKSDIDRLREDNEEFKAQLMSSTSAHEGSSPGEGGSDLRGLLEALKADIGNLRDENDLLRSQAFAAQDNSPIEVSEDQEIYGMLAELKNDINTLRHENDALRAGDVMTPPVRSVGNNDEVALMLRELKSDINDLKHENESLRIENLTARDGAHFENLGGQQGAYRNTETSVISSLLKGIGAIALVAGAAGGGFYLAKTQTGPTPLMERPAPVASQAVNSPAISQQAPTLPQAKPPAMVAKPVAPPARVEIVKTPVAPKTVPPKPSVSSDVETAMMARANGLLDARDIGAARMVFVYLARHGSAVAMTRLAQTYDPEFLGAQGFDEAKDGDLVRAKRLYGAASGMGDKEAETRLLEMQ